MPAHTNPQIYDMFVKSEEIYIYGPQGQQVNLNSRAIKGQIGSSGTSAKSAHTVKHIQQADHMIPRGLTD